MPEVIACERRLRAKSATPSSEVAISPPSPQEKILLEKKLKAPARPIVPSFRSPPGSVASGLWAASSMSASPCSSQSRRSGSSGAA